LVAKLISMSLGENHRPSLVMALITITPRTVG
jgi:hypothetical protein